MGGRVFHTNPPSRGRIVHWLREELGQACRTVWLDCGSAMKSSEDLAINPTGKMPALRGGDVVVTGAAAMPRRWMRWKRRRGRMRSMTRK